MRSLWKGLRRVGTFIFCILAVIYLFVLACSRIPVAVHDEDLAFPRVKVSAESNAVERLEQAAEQFHWPQGDGLRISQELIEMTNWDDAYAGELLATNAEALDGWDKAAQIPMMQVSEFLITDELPDLRVWRNLSRLASLRETYQMVHGQTNEAFEGMLAQARLGCRMRNAHGAVIHYLVGVAVTAESLKAMRQWTTNVSAEELRTGIDALGALRSAEAEALANSVKVEYSIQKQAVEDIRSGRYYEREEHVAIRPSFFVPAFNYTKTMAMLARADRSLIESAPSHFSETKPLDLRYHGGAVSTLLSGNFAGLMMYHLSIPTIATVMVKKCNCVVNLEATRTILALREYELKHGKLPTQLSDLVPEFLDKVPVDDFDGKPLRYSLEQKIVYSVGKNLKDDGADDRGEEEWNPSQRHLDAVFRFEF